MIIYQPPKAAERIEAVDFSGALSPDIEARRAVAWDIHRACRETGFFYLTGHGVPAALMEGQLEQSRRFFALPAEDKLKLRMNADRRGYEPVAAQTLDSGAPPDLKESLMLGREPPGNPWPEGLAGFREQAQAYTEQMTALGRRLASILALSLDLPEGFFAQALEEPNCTVRLLRYPPHPRDAAFNQLGSGAHTDWGFLTILLQDQVGGLEVRNVEGDWIRAAPVPGAFIVNLGDMVPVFTGGLYASNFHRVLNNTSGVDRYSVATFFNPPADYAVDLAPTLRPPGHVPAPITFGQHIQAKFRETYGA